VSRPDLALFAHVVGRGEDDFDVARAALLIAEPEYPSLDIPHYIALLDQLGGRARRALEGVEPGVLSARRLLGYLYEELGFRGNDTDYYDPRNCFINEVLDRRTGIPISLAIVLTEVARRASVPAQGVSFPGHFLVRVPVDGGIVVIDPFQEQLLTAEELRGLYQSATGRDEDPDPRLLAPAGSRQILLRILTNLRSIYAKRVDIERLRAVIERMAVLAPGDRDLLRELERLGGELPPAPGDHGRN